MPSLWFIVPAAGRTTLARICLEHLRRTCDHLCEHGIHATAVVIAADENLDTALDLGFAAFGRVNEPLSRKFNDGICFALNADLNPHTADYVVPIGSDDFVDARLFLNLPRPNQILGFRQAAFVSEDGRQIVSRHVDYEGGVGIRVFPRQVLEPLAFRPADETRDRGCDTSILVNVTRSQQPKPQIVYGDLHPYQVVDWKTPGEQLNTYDEITARFRGQKPADPFETLADIYPADLLERMEAYYERLRRRPTVNFAEGGFTQYRVLRRNGYRGFEHGATFEATLDRGAEGRALARGDIAVMDRVTPSLQPGSYTLPRGWLNSKEEGSNDG